MHIVAQATYEDPRSVYHIDGTQSESQGKDANIEEVKEHYHTL